MQPNAKLLTRSGELVHEFIILPFQLMPEVAIWGERIFVLRKPFEQEFGKPAEPIYYEACPWSVAASDMLARSLGPTAPQITIVVNGLQLKVTKPTLTYETIVEVAGLKGTPSCTYSGEGQVYRLQGILAPGESVKLVEGMVFSVAHTNNA